MEHFAELYRHTINSLKVRMEPVRATRQEIGDEGFDVEEAFGILAAPAQIQPLDYKKCFKKKELWFPKAKQVARIKSQGKHAKLYPEGLIIHYNAGRYDPVGTMNSGRSNNYLFSAMGRDGQVLQSNPLNEWGYHAGSSTWSLGGKKFTGVSARFHGLEISSAGVVTKNKDGTFAPWFGKKASDMLPADQVRYAKKGENITGNAYFHVYTPQQEAALIDYILWLKVNNPDVFNLDGVAGHDEVAVPFGRKSDPGGSLSMTMPKFRATLKELWEALNL